MPKNKILIAAGGTGGHLFPAQALAKELVKQDSSLELLFSGGELSKNPFFKRELFPFKEIATATPYLRKGKSFLKILTTICKGIYDSFRILKTFKPTLVVSFGSFHTFPLLFASLLTRTPYLLVELDTKPGKVNRLFSRWALLTALRFSEAETYLKGKKQTVHISTQVQKEISREEALSYYGLSQELPTLLVFGGSQGAKAINTLVWEASHLLVQKKTSYQVLHFTGVQPISEHTNVYQELGIPSHVKPFEERMEMAWTAADLVICRAGSGTIAEMVTFGVPGLLIPYPHSSDGHQQKNGHFIEEEVKGGVCLEEETLTPKILADTLALYLSLPAQLQTMRKALQTFKNRETQDSLASLVMRFII